MVGESWRTPDLVLALETNPSMGINILTHLWVANRRTSHDCWECTLLDRGRTMAVDSTGSDGGEGDGDGGCRWPSSIAYRSSY